jgi:tripartite-type tricarboxylate transporter receptor subunit TctC
MKSLNSLGVFGLVGTFGLAMTVGGVAHADALSDFYKKTRVKMIVSSTPGGGYDAYARTMSRHLPNHIPGRPKFIVQNKPGAGGVIAANFLYNVAPQDGSVIAGLQRTVPLDQIMGFKGPRFDPVKFQWLGSVTNEAGVIGILKSAKAKSIEDVFKYKTILGSTGPSDSEIYPALMNNIMGAKFQLIGGYPGSSQIHLALQRGEVQGYSQSWSSFKVQAGPTFLKTKFNPLVQISLKPLPEMTKLGVPMIMDIVDRKHVLPQYSVEEAKTWWRLMLTSKAMGRPYVVGPGVPANKVKALRKAFMDTAKDPAFIKDANRQGRAVSPISGQEVQDMIAALATAPKSTIDRVKDLIKYKGTIKKVKIVLAKHTGKVTATKRGGRRIFFDYKGKKLKAKVSGSRTKVTLNGKKVKRKAIKIGMTCTFTYPGPGSEAKKIDCKG